MLKELTNEEFRNFCHQFPTHSLYQTPEYAFTMNHQNFDTVFLGLVDENNNIKAASLFLIEKLSNFKYAYAPRGFLIDYQDFDLVNSFTREIKKYLGKKNVIAVKINPLIVRFTHEPHTKITRKDKNYDTIYNYLKSLGFHHLGYNYLFEALKPRYEAIVDLNQPYYTIFKNIRKEFRTKIRGAEERGMKVYKGSIDDLNYLYLHTQKKYPRDLQYFKDCYHFFEKRNAVDFFYVKLDTNEYLQIVTKKYHKQEAICNEWNHKLSKLKGKDNYKILNQKMEADLLFNKYKQEMILATRLLREKPNGIVTASALIIKNEKQVYLLMDGYDTKYKKLNAKHLLIWKLFEKYSNEGFTSFNLGGVTNLDLPKNPYDGLNKFKLGFQPTVFEYMGDMELITNSTLYFMYRNSAPIRNILKK